MSDKVSKKVMAARMSKRRSSAILPSSTRRERFYDVVSPILEAAVPVLGSAMSNVLNGMSEARRMERIGEVLQKLNDRIDELDDESERYVKTDLFEDLLFRTLRQAGDERSEEKRRLYADFLAGALELGEEDAFEEQIMFLRTLDQILPIHMRFIEAMLRKPPAQPTYQAASRHQVLADRTGLSKDRVNELIQQLQAINVVAGLSGGLVTGAGAEDFSSGFTPYGAKLINFLRSSPVCQDGVRTQ